MEKIMLEEYLLLILSLGKDHLLVDLKKQY